MQVPQAVVGAGVAQCSGLGAYASIKQEGHPARHFQRIGPSLSFGQGVFGSYGFLPLDFLVFARFFVSGSAEGFGSAKQLHIRHNILMSI